MAHGSANVENEMRKDLEKADGGEMSTASKDQFAVISNSGNIHKKGIE